MEKHFKPNLVDPFLEKKIIKTLKPVEYDYWAPTKSTANSFWNKYGKKYILLWILLLSIFLFLLYRYRSVKMDRKKNKINDNKTDNTMSNKEYSELLIKLYNKQKELMREPESGPKNLAYPIYGNTNGGVLIPPSK